MSKKLLIVVFVILSFGVILVHYSLGAEYPTKPIEILVSYGPGGPSDLAARQVAEVARKYLGQPLFVSNKIGAGGTVAMSEIISSKPDGYKILYIANNYLAATIYTQKIPFDPSYVIPLINFVEAKTVLYVRSDSAWKTLGQLLDYARQNPGKLTWNHTGRGTGPYINTALIFRRAGVETSDVPFPTPAEQIAAVLGGHVDAGTLPYSSVKEQLRGGNFRILVTYSDHRYSDTPDVPCSAELGFPDSTVVTFHGINVHKDTPDGIKKTLFEAFKKTVEDPQFRKAIEFIGDEPRFGGPEFIMESIKKMREIQLPIIKELGLYVGGK